MGFIINPYWFVSSTPPGDDYKNYYSNDFDGTNDYVETGLSLTDLGITNKFTVSCWFYADTFTNYDGIFGAASAGNFNDGFGVYFMATGVLRFFVGVYSQTANYVETTLSTGQWYHLLCCYDGSLGADNVKLYVDGVAIANGVNGDRTGNVPDSGGELRIATVNSTGSHYGFDGRADEFAIWNTDKRADVSTIYNSGVPDDLTSLSPIDWYRMGDGANYPIVKNQAHFSQTAVDFDGTDDAVVITDSGEVPTAFQGLGNNNDYSCSAWIKTSASTGGGSGYWFPEDTIAEIRNESSSATHCPFSFGVTANKLWLGRTENHITGSENVASVSTVNDGNWHHVAFTIDDDAWVLYIDGSSNASGTFSTATGDCSVATTTSNFVIGARTTNTGGISSPFDGEIDDCSFYNTTLSASDITDIYNSGYPKDESERSGLLTYYKFDGDVYPVVRDAMQFSNASLVFDGANDFVDLGTGLNSYLELGDSFSYSAWVKFSADTTHRTIISSLQASGPKGTQLRVLNTEAIRIIFIQSGAVYKYVDSSVLAVDTWHHVVATYDGSNTVGGINLYINGSLDNSTTGTSGTLTSITSAESLKIGKYASSSNMYEGNIDDVIVFNAELSASDVTDIYNSGKPKDESSTSNVVGYWRMGDNTISPNVPSALGYGTHSVEFDGTNDYVTMGDVLNQDGTSAFSMSFWLNLDTLPASGGANGAHIVGKMLNSGTYAGYSAYIYSNKLRFALINSWSGNALAVDTVDDFATGSWKHVVVTYDGGQDVSDVKIYINGSSQTLTTIHNTLSSSSTTTAPLTIGSRNGTALYLDGKIAQVGIFNIELSASDVTSIYNSGKTKDISSESGLVSYYRMGDGEDKYPNILDYKGTNHGTMTNMASDDITTANVGSGAMTNMTSDDIVADSPSGTSGQMTNMASDDFVAAKGAGTMTNMTAEDIVADVPS